jgi:hypothetical protein
MEKEHVRVQESPLAAAFRAVPFLVIAILSPVALRAQSPIVESKISFKRVVQAVQPAHRSDDVAGVWESTSPARLYLTLRENGGTFKGSAGTHENAQATIPNLNVAGRVVRFTLSPGPIRDTSVSISLTLKDDHTLEGLITLTAVGPLSGKFTVPLDDSSIAYTSRPLSDSASDLNRRIQRGEVRLRRDRTSGYLRSVLEAFHVPIESQVAVFSKTSLQRKHTSPRNPRTIFFNDEVSIAWVRGGKSIDVAALDPRQGFIFYELSQKRAGQPQFQRNDRDCLFCHRDPLATLSVPGLFMSSVYPVSTGMVMRNGGYVDHRTPLERRWGGWYVTAKSASARHLGNAVVTDPGNPLSMVSDTTLHVESLKGRSDERACLSPHSDIVALMVLDHQAHMTNLLIRMGWETRSALHRPDHDSDWIGRGLLAAAQQVVDYMLFIDEAPLTGKIQGTSGFTVNFSTQGPTDSQGRSLRQFELEKRLFRYPCSFMIYSRTFDALPDEARSAIYKRMWQVLSGEEMDERYGRLTLSDRQQIIEILLETKKGLPDYFQPL